MFIRFVIADKDEDSGKRQGIFQAIADIEDELSTFEADQLEANRKWFNENLDVPTSFSKSGKYHAANVAISWFRDTAKEHILRMRELASLLENHGVEVTTVNTSRPGYIVYEDTYQVVAEPFKATRT